MIRYIIIFGFISTALLLFSFHGSLKRRDSDKNMETGDHKKYRIMFWNTENLFDYLNDTLTEDEEFLPESIRHWTREKYEEKLIHVYKTIFSAGFQIPPEIIGLCEIENKKVIFDLIQGTPFKYFKYKFVHHESSDRRGIDVAFQYNPGSIRVIEERPLPVNLNKINGGGTRDILYVRAAFLCEDTVSFFINHWPSKYGGAGITEKFRKFAAETLRMSIDSLQKRLPKEKIIIMGDFNDPPESNSILLHLGCVETLENGQPVKLFNVSKARGLEFQGSHKYQGIWEMLDQFIVNGYMLRNCSKLCTSMEYFKVYSPSFLLENDNNYGGKKPFRTWNGMKYQAGFSDHLPILLDLNFISSEK